MGQASVNKGVRRRRGSPRLPFIWLPALAALLALVMAIVSSLVADLQA